MAWIARPVAALLALEACAPAPRDRPTVTSAPRPVSAPRPAAPAGAPSLDPATLAMLDDLDRITDPLHTYFVVSQAAPAGFRPIPASTTGTFPGAAFAEVRAYTYRLDGALGLDAFAPGCGEHAVAADGTMCPSVAAKGALLDAGAVARLLDTLARPDPDVRGVRTMCEFSPHHAFVFRDGAGRPVAEVLVCFECGEWLWVPSPAGTEPMMGRRRDDLRALCRDLGLGGCHLGDDDVSRGLREAARTRPLPAPRPTPGVDQAQSERQVSSLDARRLCADFARRLLTTTTFRLESGLACENGRVGRFTSLAACIEHFPRCEASVGRVAACQSALTSDVCLGSPAARAACDGVEACLWGARTGMDRAALGWR